MQQFFEHNVCQTTTDPESDARRILLGGTVEAYNTLEIPVADQDLHRLAHVTMLDWVGNPKPHGPEGMSYVQEFTGGGRQSVIWLRAIEGAVHLIPLEPERKWIVNNRVDYNVWNEMNDE